jgi:cytochrome P450
MNNFPGPNINLLEALPSMLMGNNPLAQDPVKFAESLFEEYGDTVLIDSGVRKIYFTRDTSLIRHVLIEQPRQYKKANPYEQVGLFLGNGILNSEGDFWRDQRSMVQPGFAKSPLNRFVNVMKQTSAHLSDNLSETTTDVSIYAMKIALENICQFLFGADFSKHEAIIREAVHFGNEFISKRVRSLLPLPIELPFPSHLMFQYYKWRLDQVIYQMIDERTNAAAVGHDLASMLIAAELKSTNGKIRRKQVRDELITLLVAGHETTGYTLAMALYMLAIHPDIQKKLRTELREKISNTKTIEAESLNACTYLTAVLEETLRLYPAAWIMGRKIVTDEDWHGKTLRAGAEFHIIIQALHCDSKLWTNGRAFEPERFLPENADKIDRHAYLPFGAGPRKCVGSQFAMLEMQVAVAHLLLRYEVSPTSGAEPEIEYLFTARLKAALPLHFKPVK